MASCSAHDPLLFLTRRGRAHVIPAYRVPEASRTASGTAVAQVGAGQGGRGGGGRQQHQPARRLPGGLGVCVGGGALQWISCHACQMAALQPTTRQTPLPGPAADRWSPWLPLQLLGMEAGDTITAMMPLGSDAAHDTRFVVMATAQVRSYRS